MLQWICCVSPTLQEVSHALGPGKINKLQENKAITMKAFEVQSCFSLLFFFQIVSLAKSSEWDCCVIAPLQPDDLIFLRINLCVDAFTIKELNLRWKSEAGIVENIESIVEEYRNTRQLLVSSSLPFIQHTAAAVSILTDQAVFFLNQIGKGYRCGRCIKCQHLHLDIFPSQSHCQLEMLTALFWSFFSSKYMAVNTWWENTCFIDTSCLCDGLGCAKNQSFQFPSAVEFIAVANICPLAAPALLSSAENWMIQQDHVSATHPEDKSYKNSHFLFALLTIRNKII